MFHCHEYIVVFFFLSIFVKLKNLNYDIHEHGLQQLCGNQTHHVHSLSGCGNIGKNLFSLRKQNRITLISILLLVFIPLFLKIEKQTNKEKQKSNPTLWILQLLEDLYEQKFNTYMNHTHYILHRSTPFYFIFHLFLSVCMYELHQKQEKNEDRPHHKEHNHENKIKFLKICGCKKQKFFGNVMNICTRKKLT